MRTLTGWTAAVVSAPATRIVVLLVGIVLPMTPAWCADAALYQTDPRGFMRTAVQNELNSHRNEARFMWKQTSRKPRGATTKLMIETRECVISRTIAKDGHPLTPDDRKQDDARVTRLLSDPDALHRKQQEQQQDEDRANKALRAIPDAFLFKFVGLEKDGNVEVVHYTFEPDPKFNPPNRESMVFQGMRGDVFVNPAVMHIVKIDATLFRDVPFGWGILGRLYKGGQFLIEQRDIGGNRWETTHSVLHFTGKVLLFKSLNIQQDESLTDFRQVPDDLTVAQGIDYLKKADAVVARNENGN